MKIPICNLTRQYRHIEAEINNAVLSTLRQGIFTLGPEVSAFENEFAAWVDMKFAIGVGSGTDALTLALKAIDVGPKDDVIVPANSYPSAFGLSLTGARLRMTDVGEDGNINPTHLPSVITKRTKAVVAVHLYGNPADIPAIQKVTPIPIIEDCAQAHGAKIGVRSVGTFGTIGCFSFYPTKNLGAYGDGGMLVTHDKALAHRLRALRMYGEIRRYESEEISGVSRLDELQAAILRVKLRHLATWNDQREKIVRQYRIKLKGIGDIRFISTDNKVFHSSFHLCVIRTTKRDALRKHLAHYGIQTAIHYPTPIHLTRAYHYLGYKKGDFPVAESLSREILSLPLFPELTEHELETVIRRITQFF